MQAYHELSQVAPKAATVLTVGVFDGVHRGHQHLLQHVLGGARAQGCLAAAVTFRNHPRAVLFPGNPVSLLTPVEERLRLLRAQGLDLVVPVTFDRELSHLEPRQICALLQEKLRMQSLVIGPTFAMGFQRKGTPEVLRELGREMGFTVPVVEALMEDGTVVSSTALRQALDAGDVGRAARYLGRLFALEGTAVPGERRGRDLGFPTANLALPGDQTLPGDGVYATWAYLEDNHPWRAATSIGVRPTFGGGQRTVEAFLIGFRGDLYQRRVRLEFAHRLRDEVRFDSREALIQQMKEDVRQTEEVLEGTRAVEQ